MCSPSSVKRKKRRRKTSMTIVLRDTTARSNAPSDYRPVCKLTRLRRFDKGVLKVTLPEVDEAKKKQMEVKVR
jgi:hypothetical protein